MTANQEISGSNTDTPNFITSKLIQNTEVLVPQFEAGIYYNNLKEKYLPRPGLVPGTPTRNKDCIPLNKFTCKLFSR